MIKIKLACEWVIMLGFPKVTRASFAWQTHLACEDVSIYIFALTGDVKNRTSTLVKGEGNFSKKITNLLTLLV